MLKLHQRNLCRKHRERRVRSVPRWHLIARRICCLQCVLTREVIRGRHRPLLGLRHGRVRGDEWERLVRHVRRRHLVARGICGVRCLPAGQVVRGRRRQVLGLRGGQVRADERERLLLHVRDSGGRRVHIDRGLRHL